MPVHKRLSKVTLVFALFTSVALATHVAAYNGSDFQNPPDWLAHGNDRSNPGYSSYEPINTSAP